MSHDRVHTDPQRILSEEMTVFGSNQVKKSIQDYTTQCSIIFNGCVYHLPTLHTAYLWHRVRWCGCVRPEVECTMVIRWGTGCYRAVRELVSFTYKWCSLCYFPTFLLLLFCSHLVGFLTSSRSAVLFAKCLPKCHKMRFHSGSS